MEKEAGIVIVTFNSQDVIGECLDACLTRTAAEVVVVDNASVDTTVDEVKRRPSVKLIANRENRGFAAAVNQGVAALDRRFVLVLNPDVVLMTGIEPLRAACAQPRVAAAGGKLLSKVNGQPQAGFAVRRLPTAATLCLETLGMNRLFPWNPVNRRFRCLDYDLEKPRDAQQPAGAFLMLSRQIWRELGGFDESFQPLWFEDVDFCKRVLDKGYRIQYEPKAVGRHLGGHSLARLDPGYRMLYWYASLLRYASKHFRRSSRQTVCAAVVLASVLRGLYGVVSERSLRPVRGYAKVVRLASLCLISGRVGGVRR